MKLSKAFLEKSNLILFQPFLSTFGVFAKISFIHLERNGLTVFSFSTNPLWDSLTLFMHLKSSPTYFPLKSLLLLFFILHYNFLFAHALPSFWLAAHYVLGSLIDIEIVLCLQAFLFFSFVKHTCFFVSFTQKSWNTFRENNQNTCLRICTYSIQLNFIGLSSWIGSGLIISPCYVHW